MRCLKNVNGFIEVVFITSTFKSHRPHVTKSFKNNTSLGGPGPESWSRPETEKQEKQEKQAKHKEKQAKSKFCLFFLVFCLFCLFFLFSWARAGPQSWSRPETRKQEKH